MVMIEVEIGLIPANFIHINMLDFKSQPKVHSRSYSKGGG